MICFSVVATRFLRCSVQRLPYRQRILGPQTASTAMLGHCARWDAVSVDKMLHCHPSGCVTVLQSSRIHLSASCTLACQDSSLTEAEYENIVIETLDSLADCLENLPETVACPDDFDITFGDGVLTLCLGGSLGTYVINKQTPNKQIWLSSPTSGPKRYDYQDKHWVYSRNKEGLHTLLERELSAALQTTISLAHCTFYS